MMKLKISHSLLRAAIGTVLFLSLHMLLLFGFLGPAESSLSPSSPQNTNSIVSHTLNSSDNSRMVAQTISATDRFQRLVEADELYRAGNTAAATAIYRQLKPPFPNEGSDVVLATIDDPTQLPPAGQVYWRNGQQGVAQGLQTLTLESLQRLVDNYPEFIPGQLLLAQMLEKYNRPEAALDALEKATALYPDQPDLLKAKIDALAKSDQFLEASVAARQFTLIYPDYAEADEFARLADEYRDRYRSKIRDQVLGQTIVGTLVGGLQGFLSGDWSKGLSGVQTLLMLTSNEAEMGSKLAETYRGQLSLLDDAEVLNYIKGIGGRLTPLMGRRDLEYEYYLVKDDSINAFALPGGKVFVNTGAILHTDSEAELAGLLGHEISHAALSHGYQRLANSSLLSNLQGLIPFGNLITNLVVAQYSRENERQADILGSRVLASNGYAADGLRNLMVTLREQTGPEARPLLATHPAPADRVLYLESLIRRNGYNRYAYEGVKTHQDMQNRLKGLPPDESQNTVVATQPQLQGGRSSSPSASANAPAANSAGTSNSSVIAAQTRDSVTIRLENVRVSPSGTLTANLIIENQSDRPFGFVPLFAKVTDADNRPLSARISFNTSGDVLVPAGDRLEGQLSVFGHAQRGSASQDWILTITEGTSGGRLFRIQL
jgi:predicted Zn-dependent protease